MAEIAAVHDLSGLGRCSLVTAISVLSAMGHHCCPVPTAVLSAQTGFPHVSCLELTARLPGYLDSWKALSFAPDMIYTGFLGSADQPSLLAAWIEEQKQAIVVVDPVMADDGALYPCYSPAFVEEMKGLAKRAHILTPNLTEFCLLAGVPAKQEVLPAEALLELARALPGDRLGWVVITGIPRGDQVENLLLDLREGSVRISLSHSNGISYSGTGDLFASVLCGAVADGLSVPDGVELAAGFLNKVTAVMDPKEDPRHGVGYEAYLGELADRRERNKILGDRECQGYGI